MATQPLPPDDLPLPVGDPFHQEMRLLLAPRVNPAEAPGPPGNPDLDLRAVERVARMLRSILG
jgi:hypothetical protein